MMVRHADGSSTVTASDIGWVRRPDLDGDAGQMWVIPVGAYIAFPLGDEPRLTIFTYLPVANV